MLHQKKKKKGRSKDEGNKSQARDKAGNPSRADAGGADWLPHVDPDLRETEPSKGVVRRMPLNARPIFSRKHKTARASIEGTNSERVTEMGGRAPATCTGCPDTRPFPPAADALLGIWCGGGR